MLCGTCAIGKTCAWAVTHKEDHVFSRVPHKQTLDEGLGQ